MLRVPPPRGHRADEDSAPAGLAPRRTWPGVAWSPQARSWPTQHWPGRPAVEPGPALLREPPRRGRGQIPRMPVDQARVEPARDHAAPTNRAAVRVVAIPVLR